MSCTQIFQIVFIFWNLWPQINCRMALTKVFLEPVSFRFYSTQVCDRRLANWIAITDYINDEWIYKERKAWFNSCKWSNLAWSSSSCAPIYFCILPLRGIHFVLILTLGQWQNAFDNVRLRKNLIFF